MVFENSPYHDSLLQNAGIPIGNPVPDTRTAKKLVEPAQAARIWTEFLRATTLRGLGDYRDPQS